MFLKRSNLSSSSAYAAWINAAVVAHRSGSTEDKARAERLYVERKHIERRVQRTADRMRANNRPTGSEWRRA